MVMRPAIRVDGLSKQYRLGQRSRPSDPQLRDMISDGVRGLWGRLRHRGRGARANAKAARDGAFWALKDVSFEVRPGEVVGIIGRNGAGKSTLLKILSQVVEPTSGRAEVRGRMGSLLEVGTGFHPELTGRENVYLNGSILGMRRREIDRKFDRIVEFSEIEQFIDTPVKRYSSGMYVRLAFAVAAHLEPEILIVDEVLAVGDARFQKKCLGQMSAVTRQGRTILFVSHNMGALRSLCTRSIALDRGAIVMDGPTGDCIDYYTRHNRVESASEVCLDRPRDATPWMTRVRLLSDHGKCSSFAMGDRLGFEVEFASNPPISDPNLGYVIRSADGAGVLNANTRFLSVDRPGREMPQGVIRCDLGVAPLLPGSYSISLWLGTEHGDTHIVENAIEFEVYERDIWGNGQLPPRTLSYCWWPTSFSIEKR
jgi:lipopolysaccharide transport system ATP-binding protein